MSLKKNHYAESSLNQYKSNEISTMSQSKLIVMLYEGAIRFLKIAAENMTPRKYEMVHNNIMKAQDIVTELMVSLNMEEGGEVAENLLSIYAYIKKRLLEANMEKKAEILEESIKLLEDLRSAWSEVATKDKGLGGKPDALLHRGSSFSIQG